MVTARGYLFLFLNAVRVLSIVALLLLFASSILSMVDDIKAVNAFVAAGKTSSDIGNSTASSDPGDEDYIENSTVPNQPAGAFWAVLNWLLIIFQALVLVLSELSLPFADRFFASYFPVLSPDFGLGALGVIQCLLGAAVLSHRVNEFTLVAAFFLFSVGCLNVLLGLVFRERAKARRSAAWGAERKDVLPTVRGLGVGGPVPFAPPPGLFSSGGAGHAYGYGYDEEKGAARSGSLSSQKSGLGFGRQAAKFAANQGYVVREPEEAVPPYAPKPTGTVHFVDTRARSHVSVSSVSASEYTDDRSRSDRHEERYEIEEEEEEREEEEEEEEEEEHGRASPRSIVRTDSSATAVDRH